MANPKIQLDHKHCMLNNRQIIALSIVLACILIAYYSVDESPHWDVESFKWVGYGADAHWDASIPYRINFDYGIDCVYVHIYQETIPGQFDDPGKHLYLVYKTNEQELIIIVSPIVISLAIAFIRKIGEDNIK